MLRHLRVTNFAILSDVSIELGPGMNVLTGETGAGKSLIVEAVNLLRGGRASADIPRQGADEAVVEAIFEIPEDLADVIDAHLEAAGLGGGDELLVRRVIQKGGRSRTYINGALTTASRLSEIGAYLIDLSGQHQHQGLVDARRHTEIVDAFAARPGLVRAMRQAHEARAEAADALEAVAGGPVAVADRLDFLRYQLDELEAAELGDSAEEESLERERKILEAADRLIGGAEEVEQQLYGGDGSAVERIDGALRTLEELATIDESLGGFVEPIREARVLIEDTARSIRSYARTIDGDPGRLRAVHDRLDLLRRLCRKHGCELGELIARSGELQAELESLESRDDRLAELSRKLDAADTAAHKAAAALTASRKRAAARLASEVSHALGELGMNGAALEVAIEPRPDGAIGPAGADRVELLLRANPGEAAKPLTKVASGGELSRIMLAIKMILRRADSVATYVFDEVDTGIGGATAEVVGGLIRDVSETRQVLCVTHLPQIAAFGGRHFRVDKAQEGGRTETEVAMLSEKDRVVEIARMLAGVKITPQARAHAREMLKSCRTGRARAPFDTFASRTAQGAR